MNCSGSYLQKTYQFTLQRKNQAEIKQINKELSRVKASRGRLDELENSLSKKEQELTGLENTVDIPTLREEIKELEQQKATMDDKLRRLE